MAITRATLRQEVAKNLGDYFPITTSACGTTLQFVAAALKDLPGSTDCCYFEGWDALINEACHCANGCVRRVSAYAQSTTTVTVPRAYCATIGNNVCIELYRNRVEDYHRSVDQAIEESFPFVYRALTDETIVIDDRLTNGDFECFTSCNFCCWTAVNCPTLSANTSIVMHGCQSANVVAGGSAGQLTQTLTVNVKEITEKNVSFNAWVYATAACAARIRVDFGGCCIKNSCYHTGQDRWELLKLNETIPTTATQVKVIVEAAACQTVRFDAAWAMIDHIHEYTVPSAFRRVNHIYQQERETYPNGVYHPFRWADRGHRLRIEGQGLLTRPANCTTTIEICEPRARFIAAMATKNMVRTLWQRSAGQVRDRYLEDLEYWTGIVDGLLTQPGIPSPKMGAGFREGWQIITTDETMKLVLKEDAS